MEINGTSANRMDVDEITDQVIGAAIDVHRELGPGLLESTYRACLYYEIIQRGLRVEREKALPVVYKRVNLDCGYRVDIVVEDAVIVELKVVEKFAPIHTAQLLTYLKLSGRHVGLLLNFDVPLLRDGIRRVVHNLPPRPQRPLR